MNKTICRLLATVLLWMLGYVAHSQGTFRNLNFEAANVQDLPPMQGEIVAVSNGVPGWTVYIGGSQPASMPHNTLPLGGAAVAIYGPQWPTNQILQGSYTVDLIPSSAGPPTTAAIGQTGLIPLFARSVEFWGNGIYTLSFAGQQIPLFALGSGPNYTIFGGDISAFADQTGELQFTGNGLLDSISFSNQPIPEPSVVGLSALGAVLPGWRLWRKRR